MTKFQYRKQLQDPRWLVRRAARIILSGGKCERCDSTSRVNVHHRHYIEGRSAWDYEDEVLEVLCRSCHEKEHGIDVSKRRKPEERLTEQYWEWEAKIQQAKAEYFRLDADVTEKQVLSEGCDNWSSSQEQEIREIRREAHVWKANAHRAAEMWIEAKNEANKERLLRVLLAPMPKDFRPLVGTNPSGNGGLATFFGYRAKK